MEIQMEKQSHIKAASTQKPEATVSRNSEPSGSNRSSLAGWHCLLAVLLSDGPTWRIAEEEQGPATTAA